MEVDNMKKFIMLSLIFIITAAFIGCNPCNEKIDAKDKCRKNETVSSSEQPVVEEFKKEKPKFTATEIKQAIYIATVDFQKQEGCTLIRMVYNKDESDKLAKVYAKSENNYSNVNERNVIVLICDFEVDKACTRPEFNAGETYKNCTWTLIRESNNSPWVFECFEY